MPAAVGFQFLGSPGVAFTKAKQAEEVFLTKNAHYTKHELERAVSKPLMNNNVVNLDTDHPMYKKKRKALSGAFFKSKMSVLA